MNIRQLIELTGTTERQVRYLISQGLMPPPSGGRSKAEYGEPHVNAIQRYARLHELGFPPAAIKLLLDAGTGIPVPVGKGVTLIIDPARIGNNDAVEPIVNAVREHLTRSFAPVMQPDRSGETDA